MGVVYTASQLGEGGPPSINGTTPTTALGAMLSNLSPWWLLFSVGDRAPYNIPPFSAFRVPISQGAQPWTLEPTTFDPGQLTVGQTYVELDFSTTTLPLELRTMAQLPVYQQQVGGGVDILNQPTVNIAAGASIAINAPVTIETAAGTPIEVTGGVTISGTATVSISGTPTVQIAAGQLIEVTNVSGSTLAISGAVSISGTPAVTIDTSGGAVAISGTVTISGVTSVSISGTPTVQIAANQLIQVENATGGSLTIAGTVNIGNTPAVTIDTSGGAVSVTGSVTISGTATVSISGTPAVTISSGTVDIGSGNLTIVGGQGGVNVQVETPPSPAGAFTIAAAGDKSASLLLTPPAGATGALMICNTAGAALTLTGVTAVGQTSGFGYTPAALNTLNNATPAAYACSLPGAYEEILFSLNFLNGGAAGAVVGELIWLFGAEIVYPVVPLDQPLFTRGTRANATNNADQIVTGAAALLGPTGIDQVVSKSPPAYDLVINSSLAANASVTLLAGTANTQIRIRRLQVTGTSAGQLVFRTVAGGGTVLLVTPYNEVANTPDLDFEGFALPTGADLILQNVGTGTVNVSGRVTADQY